MVDLISLVLLPLISRYLEWPFSSSSNSLSNNPTAPAPLPSLFVLRMASTHPTRLFLARFTTNTAPRIKDRITTAAVVSPAISAVRE